MTHRFASACLLFCIAIAALGPSHASKIYRWTDRNGVVHYGDHAPDSSVAGKSRVTTIPVRAEPGAMARLRLESSNGRYFAWADNTLAGPIEVMLQLAHNDNIVGDPPLPARATVPAGPIGTFVSVG